MVEVNFRSAKGFTFDTCVGIKVCENPNLGSLLSCRINFEGSQIHLSSQTVFEAKRLGHDVEHLSKQIQNLVGARVISGIITAEMQNDAQYLEGICETLHPGDSQILAYARATGTILVTCDKGLAEAACVSGVTVVNPDILPCDELSKNVKKSRFHEIVRKAITKPVQAKQKVKPLVLKPGQKILWRSFN